jgi:GTP-binding protein
VDAEDPQSEYDGLRAELEAYSKELGRIPHCVVLTKTDVLGPKGTRPTLSAPDAWGVFAVSSVARSGLSELLEALWARSRAVARAEAGEEEDEWGQP